MSPPSHETDSLLHSDHNGSTSIIHRGSFGHGQEEQPANASEARDRGTYGTYGTGRTDIETANGAISRTDATGPSRLSTSSIFKIVAVLMIGLFTSNLDTSLVLATHPRIASEFNALEDSSWIFVSFLLAGLTTQVLYAKLSDVYGRMVILVFCYALFGAGCGLSRSMWHVILGRILSGSGGSGMASIALILTTDLVPLREVASWLGYINIISTTGRSLGGPLGGFLADRVGWRWSFSAQAPLFAIAMVACMLVVPNTKPARSSSVTGGASDSKNKLSRIDYAGPLLLGVAALLLMFPLEIGGVKVPWTHPLVFGLLAAGLLVLALFVLNESRWVDDPAVPLHLLKHKDIILSYVAASCITASQTTLMYFVPLYFQVTVGVSNTTAGLHLVPAVVANAVGGLVAGQLIRRTGSYKAVTVMSSLSASLAYILLIIRWRGDTNWWESLYIIPGGFGAGMGASALFVGLNAVIEPAHKAVIVSGLQLALPVGMLLGVTASSAALFGLIQTTLDQKLLEIGLSPESRSEIISKSIADVEYIRQIPTSLRHVVISCYVDGFRASFSVILAFSLIGLLAGSFIKSRRL
ncbi:major facilitator superfamily transporter [Poronia punctata]|nr:major facilitator superfamily transporter [Poronia punctata]